MKALNVPFSICQIKISNNPSHLLSMYDIFNRENSKLVTLTISMLTQAAFYDVLRFLCQKYYDINIEDTYLRLFLGQSKTKQSIDRASGLAFAAEFRFISCQNYTDIYTNGKSLKERRECVFRGKAKKT